MKALLLGNGKSREGWRRFLPEWGECVMACNCAVYDTPEAHYIIALDGHVMPFITEHIRPGQIAVTAIKGGRGPDVAPGYFVKLWLPDEIRDTPHLWSGSVAIILAMFMRVEAALLVGYDGPGQGHSYNRRPDIPIQYRGLRGAPDDLGRLDGNRILRLISLGWHHPKFYQAGPHTREWCDHYEG